ncbi:hypothetical protein ACE6H2_011313 [Prunus campanulata]
MVAATPTQSLCHGSSSLSWRHISLERCLQSSRGSSDACFMDFEWFKFHTGVSSQFCTSLLEYIKR